MVQLKKIRFKNKRAALELSIGTIVILVLAMSMLILGLILVRTIFKSATASVDSLDDKVQASIVDMFTDEADNIVVKLGKGKTARIKADNKKIGVAFGAKTLDGDPVDPRTFKYKLELDTSARENCVTEVRGRERAVEEFLMQSVGTRLRFDEINQDTAFAIVEIRIPEGTPLCSQKVYMEVYEDQELVGSSFFIIDVIRKGFFG